MNSPVRNLEVTISSAKAQPALLSGISVIMVVFRTGPALQESLKCVLQDPLVTEFIIVDNGAAPEEIAWMDAAARQDDRVTLIRGQGNVGFASGANMGAAASSGHLVVFLNPDAFLQPGCLASLAQGVENGPSPCLVGARILNPDLSEQRGARRGEVTPVTTLLSLLRLANRFQALKRFEIHRETEASPCGRIRVPTISGAGFAMTRDDFMSFGGFDEGYFLHVEDIDLCWRVRQAGGSVWFDPGASVVHLGSTSQTTPLKVEFWKGVGLVRYFRKRADNPLGTLIAHLLAPAILGAAMFRALFLLKRVRRPD